MSTHFKKKFEFRAYHHEAVELRYQGRTYNQISLLLIEKYQKNIKENTVRHWFSSNGLLEAEYIDYAKKENDRRRQFVMEECKKLFPRIPVTLEMLLDRKDKFGNPKLDMTTLNTLKFICDILNFRVQEQDDYSNPLDEYFDRSEEEIARSKVN